MRRAKKISVVLTILVLLTASLYQAASAIEFSTQASYYLNSYGAYLYEGTTKGSVRVEYTVAATEPSDYVGVSQLSIYEANGSHVATIKGSVANGLLRKDARVHASDFTYFGKSGVTYYAVLTMYAERDGGSDSREYTTNTAP